MEKGSILGKVDECKASVRVGGEAAGVYVDIDQSNGVDRSLVTCETVLRSERRQPLVLRISSLWHPTFRLSLEHYVIAVKPVILTMRL